MAGVNANNMESYPILDIGRMARDTERIFRTANRGNFNHQRGAMVCRGNASFVDYLAEKKLGFKPAARGNSRIHGLVLERAAHLAKSASKLAIRCYSKPWFVWLHPIYIKIIVERGV
jgi:hypothetical protein